MFGLDFAATQLQVDRRCMDFAKERRNEADHSRHLGSPCCDVAGIGDCPLAACLKEKKVGTRSCAAEKPQHGHQAIEHIVAGQLLDTNISVIVVLREESVALWIGTAQVAVHVGLESHNATEMDVTGSAKHTERQQIVRLPA